MEHRFIIAIDGPAGAGKSTIARQLAQRLGYLFINTGAMYRAVALAAQERGLTLGETDAIGQLAQTAQIQFSGSVENARVSLNGEDVTEKLSHPAISEAASVVSAIPAVRRALVAQQQALGRAGGVVMEGRDIGTQVFPQAEIKIYLDATSAARAQRRYAEELAKGNAPSELAATQTAIEARDFRDQTRSDSPLVQAADAIYLDSSTLSIEDVIAQILRLIDQRVQSAAACPSTTGSIHSITP